MSALKKTQYLLKVKLLREQVRSFEKYPYHLSSIRNLDELTLHPSVTFLIGENGTGKSTLLEAIAVAWGFNPEGGTRNFRFSTRSSHSELYKSLRLVKGIKRPRDGFFLRAESLFNVATEIERLDEEGGGAMVIESYGGMSLHEQSHGESFFAVIQNRFGGNGFYILDEPEAALSPTRQMSLITLIHDLVRKNSQFIIATHSPIIMAYPNADIFSLNEEGIRKIEYTETEHYTVTKDFLNQYEKMLGILMEGEDK